MSEKNHWKITKKDSLKKLLKFLKEKLFLSNRTLKKILDSGLCSVNNKIERFGTITLFEGDEVKLFSLWQEKINKRKTDKLKILFEDDYFLAIEKPIDFVCIDKNIHKYFPDPFTLIHRLDKDTTGILLIAKDKNFKEKMIKIFKEKKIKKTYFAYLDGRLIGKTKKIEGYLQKKKSIDGQTIYSSSSQGKFALTYLEVLKQYDMITLVKLKPITGRTHQLRVHAKEISHPILGDYLYSKKFNYPHHVNRLMLHCSEIEFIHPVNFKNIKIASKIPKDFCLFDL